MGKAAVLTYLGSHFYASCCMLRTIYEFLIYIHTASILVSPLKICHAYKETLVLYVACKHHCSPLHTLSSIVYIPRVHGARLYYSLPQLLA